MPRYASTARDRSAAAALAVFASLLIGCSSSESPWNPEDSAKADSGTDATAPDGSAACTPRTCGSAQAQCGAAPDGCGGTLTCGDCPSGSFCGGNGPNRCGSTPCEPLTCQDPSHPCGVLSDGCAGTLTCNTCALPETCGGGGVQNRCGCSPSGSCAALGAECGTIGDGCGSTLDCGTCPGEQKCGAEAANRCSDCGVPGRSCCGGTQCSIGYCYQGSCYEQPWSTQEYSEGAACADIGVAHLPPAFLLRITVHGRPNATARRYCIHASCPGATAFETTDSPYMLDATGVYAAVIENSPVADCAFANLGTWDCWFEVDGQLSNHDGGTLFNSLCSETATCELGKQTCPPGG